MEYKLFVFLFLIMFYFVIFLKVVYIVLLIYFRLGKYKKKELLLSIVIKYLLIFCRFFKYYFVVFIFLVSV